MSTPPLAPLVVRLRTHPHTHIPAYRRLQFTAPNLAPRAFPSLSRTRTWRFSMQADVREFYVETIRTTHKVRNVCTYVDGAQVPLPFASKYPS